ncbi:exo-rhamnogalacturonase B [Plectosphaerella plurivora]|uniref:Exo-rhamnogalacturonase B n=1 Tax=Plectosphaerella plurivora TaxID=936078 RepID=A0A9P9AC68_9PEZI|nr:exo-rhamnogalacturonase B [Plectosphaerella plurivora]
MKCLWLAALATVPAVWGLSPLRSTPESTPEANRLSLQVSPGLPHDPQSSVDVPNEEAWAEVATRKKRKLCFVRPGADDEDDAPRILHALNKECRSKSIVVLPGPVYSIRSPMNTTHLDDVELHQFGRLHWSPDIEYWLSVSMPVGFQNQSTVWHFGGKWVTWEGHGFGTMDGNGQVWYDWAHGRGNLAHRPMTINFHGLKDSTLRGLRFVQAQMWTMNIMYSRNLILDDIYVNNTSTSEHNTLNTDGVDTMYSDNITFSRWSVTNGDDAVALKANSTNIRLYDSEFWDSTGIAIGSMGQYKDHDEHIYNFHVKNVTMHNVIRGCYFKSWTGVQTGYPPNGGGGGTGYAGNVLMEDIVLDHTRMEPLLITQCESYNGHGGENCFTSKFRIGNITWRNWSGWTGTSKERSAWFKCSEASGGCHNVTVEGWNVKKGRTDETLDLWHCDNMNEHSGFKCEGQEDLDSTAGGWSEDDL